MKTTILILLVFLNAYVLVAQTYTMQTVNLPQYNMTAQIPSSNTVIADDSSGLKMYSSLTPDSLIATQLFVYGNYSLDSNDVLLDYMQEYNETDTLKTIAQFMVANSGGELLYVFYIENAPTSKSMDIGITLGDPNNPSIMLTRIILKGKRMVILNVTGQESNLSHLVSVTDTCFNGLVVY